MNLVARLILVVIMLALWFTTQRLIGSRGFKADGIQDKVHDWSVKWNEALHQNPILARKLLILSSLGIDGLGLYVLFSGIFGPSVTPLIGIFMLFSLRQLAQYLSALPAPQGMIWNHPGVPSLFVTYGVSNDLFFSGHTALAVYAGVVLCSSGSLLLAFIGVALALFEIGIVLVLRAHWTMDVFAGAVTAFLVAYIAATLGPIVDGVF